MTPSQSSIRRTLLLWQISALLLLGVISVSFTFLLADRSFEVLRKLEMSQIAGAIARHGIESDSPDEDVDNKQPGDFLSEVWEADGSLSYSSLPNVTPRPTQTGYFDFVHDGKHWHGYASQYRGLTILVAREFGARRMLFEQLSLPMLGTVAGLTLVLALVIWVLVGRTLAPLEGLRRDLRARRPDALAALPTENLPVELEPLVGTLNALFGRVDHLLDAQRRFVADAAHELRTPITAVQLYTQLAQRSTDIDTQASALRNVEASCARAVHLVEQLLTLARLEPEAGAEPEVIALDALARGVVIGQSALAEARGVDLGLAHADPARCQGVTEDVRVLLNNLVDNAVRYTPPGGRVDVSVHLTEAGPALCVEDTGPGIPESEQQRVFDRFVRLVGADLPGSGLGLSIVRSIAQRHGARITLTNRLEGGLRVSVTFPTIAG